MLTVGVEGDAAEETRKQKQQTRHFRFPSFILYGSQTALDEEKEKA